MYKVTQNYTPKASDEIELVIGDYIYVEQKEFDNTPDGWVYGTSWLTGEKITTPQMDIEIHRMC